MPVTAFDVCFDWFSRFACLTAHGQRNESNFDVDALNSSLDEGAVLGIFDADRLASDADLEVEFRRLTLEFALAPKTFERGANPT